MQVREAVLADIATHALADAPNECCGLLVGSETRIDRAVRARNAHERPAVRFLVDPRDHFAALRAARQTGAVVCGAYHSHPRGPASPSPTDLAEAHDPSLVHLIADLSSGVPVIRGFRLIDGNFHSIELVPIG
jgi:proteasome lid subunit RPN8/RPN11